jgi:ketosteroid isomerase-like protein
MKKIFVIVAPAMMMFASCTDQTTASDTSGKKDSSAFDIAAVKSAITDANKTFGDAVVKGDSTTVANLYASDANMFPPNMPKIENHDGILAMAGELSRMGAKSVSLESTNVYGNPDLVAEEGKYTIGDGNGKTLDQGKYIVLWKQEDGKWKLYRDIWNSDMPPPPASK